MRNTLTLTLTWTFRTGRGRDLSLFDVQHCDYEPPVQVRIVRRLQSMPGVLQVCSEAFFRIPMLTCVRDRQVYEVHPAHAFLAVPDKPSSSSSSSTALADISGQNGSLDESCESSSPFNCHAWDILASTFTVAFS